MKREEGEETAARILVVEDQLVVAESICSRLRSLGYDVPGAVASGEEAVVSASETHPDLVLMDIRLEGEMDGIDAAREIRSRFDVPVVYLTAYQDDEILARAKKTQPLGYVLKPYESGELRSTIEIALYRHDMEKRLRTSEARLSATLDALPDLLLEVDSAAFIHDYRAPRGSPPGLLMADPTGRSLDEVLPADAARVVRHAIGKAAQSGGHGGAVYSMEVSGGTRWFELSISARDEPGEQDPRLVALIRDITERVEAEQTVVRFADRVKILHLMDRSILAARSPAEIADAVLENLTGLVPLRRAFIVSFDQELQMATVLATRGGVPPGTCLPVEKTGPVGTLLEGQAVGVSDITHSHPSTRLEELLVGGHVQSYVIVPLLVEGVPIGALGVGAAEPGVLNVEQIEVLEEVAVSLSIALRQSRLIGRLRDHRSQLRALAARLVEVEEMERRRLARELHDQVGQNLSALAINLNLLRAQVEEERSAGRDDGGAAHRLVDSLALLDETTRTIRSVMSELRPPLLDEYGLLPALEWYGKKTADRAGFVVMVEGDEDAPRPGEQAEGALFRIAQEALTNAAKYSRARHVTVRLEATEDGDGVRLIVADDGVGFESRGAVGDGSGSGWGLDLMRERAASVDGRLQIDARPGGGCRVEAEVPRAESQSDPEGATQ